MFNVGGPEFLVILLVALVVLGPQRLPDALRQVGKFVGEARKISTNFQNEVQEAMKDPVQKATGTELPKIPKNAKDVVDLAMGDSAKSADSTNADEVANESAESAESAEPAEPKAKKPNGPRFGSAEPAKPAQPSSHAEPAEPAEPAGVDHTVEPAQIASAADLSKMFEKNGSSAGGNSTAPASDEDSGDAEVPMFGDR